MPFFLQSIHRSKVAPRRPFPSLSIERPLSVAKISLLFDVYRLLGFRERALLLFLLDFSKIKQEAPKKVPLCLSWGRVVVYIVAPLFSKIHLKVKGGFNKPFPPLPPASLAQHSLIIAFPSPFPPSFKKGGDIPLNRSNISVASLKTLFFFFTLGVLSPFLSIRKTPPKAPPRYNLLF